MRVRYWETSRGERPVEIFITSQPTKVQAKIAWTISLLEDMGLDLLKTGHMSPLHGHKHPLYELRGRQTGIFYRILLVVAPSNTAWLLHAFSKKTDKTPRNHVDLALNRAELIDNLRHKTN